MTNQTNTVNFILRLLIALVLISGTATVIILCSGCKPSEYVYATTEGWAIHSSVPIDSTLR